jgi:DNA-binding GntR family transcriptional regulator
MSSAAALKKGAAVAPGAELVQVPGDDEAPPPLRTLPEQLADRIYAAIVGGQYQPGDRIREEALAEQYGVSRGPVREALRILERDSVVRVLPNKGAHVTRLSVKELNDIFEIRMVLAGAMVRRIAKSHRALTARFGPKVDELERLAALPDQGAAYVAASVELSLAIARASGNERLSEIMRSLARQSWRYTQLALSEPARRLESASNWRALFDAL